MTQSVGRAVSRALASWPAEPLRLFLRNDSQLGFAQFHLTAEIEIRAENENEDNCRRQHIQCSPALACLAAVFGGGGTESQSCYLGAIWIGGHVADDNHDDGRNDRDQDAEVLEIDIVHDPKERSFGITFDQPKRHRSIDEHPENANDEPNNHGPKTAMRIQPPPKNAKEEHDKYRRRQIALDRLQVIIKTVGALDHGNPGHGNHDHEYGGNSSRADQVTLGRRRLPFLV